MVLMKLFHKGLRLAKKVLYIVLPVELYLKIQYFVRFKKILNMKNPKRFSEKIYCLKLINQYQNKELIQKCYDKYSVRGYIKDKLGEDLAGKVLNELYGVYNSTQEINYKKLPMQFALKVTQSSGYNIICPNKNKLNIKKINRKLDRWVSETRKVQANEESYVYDGNSRLICEKFIKNKDGSIPDDIRVYCFHGTPKLFVVDVGTTKRDGTHGKNIIRNVYDLEWNLLDVDLGRPHDANYIIKKPNNLAEIMDIAKKLSADFYFVRVDLYNINEKEIKFGELTWIPMGGNCVIKPTDYDDLLGSWLQIPDIHCGM